MKAMVKITGNQKSSDALLSVWKDHTILFASEVEMNQFTDLKKIYILLFPKNLLLWVKMKCTYWNISTKVIKRTLTKYLRIGSLWKWKLVWGKVLEAERHRVGPQYLLCPGNLVVHYNLTRGATQGELVCLSFFSSNGLANVMKGPTSLCYQILIYHTFKYIVYQQMSLTKIEYFVCISVFLLPKWGIWIWVMCKEKLKIWGPQL